MADFSHLSNSGQADMVDVSSKVTSLREAHVAGMVRVSPECATKVSPEVLREIASCARVAGIQAAKQTSTLIPMCHQIPLSKVTIDVEFEQSVGEFRIHAATKTQSTTGVEMEAMCAASIAGITVYDMIKAVDPGAVVGPFTLEQKSGGKAGPWTRAELKQT